MKRTAILTIVLLGFAARPAGAEILAAYTDADLSKPSVDAAVWKTQKAQPIDLMAQPMANPRPAETSTPRIQVQAVHNGAWVSFRLRWSDPEKSEGGMTGTQSDGVAIQFPFNATEPPMAFMGQTGSPVHIIHWRAMFQADKERGLRKLTDYYPNAKLDAYPFEFADHGNLPTFTSDNRDMYATGRAAGNPQSSAKVRAVDEIMAEGFGTSAVLEGGDAIADAAWDKKQWTVVISRPLAREGASKIDPAIGSQVAFAVWQGGKGDVGGRKSVLMSWEPLVLAPITAAPIVGSPPANPQAPRAIPVEVKP